MQRSHSSANSPGVSHATRAPPHHDRTPLNAHRDLVAEGRTRDGGRAQWTLGALLRADLPCAVPSSSPYRSSMIRQGSVRRETHRQPRTGYWEVTTGRIPISSSGRLDYDDLLETDRRRGGPNPAQGGDSCARRTPTLVAVNGARSQAIAAELAGSPGRLNSIISPPLATLAPAWMESWNSRPAPRRWDWLVLQRLLLQLHRRAVTPPRTVRGDRRANRSRDRFHQVPPAAATSRARAARISLDPTFDAALIILDQGPGRRRRGTRARRRRQGNREVRVALGRRSLWFSLGWRNRRARPAPRAPTPTRSAAPRITRKTAPGSNGAKASPRPLDVVAFGSVTAAHSALEKRILPEPRPREEMGNDEYGGQHDAGDIPPRRRPPSFTRIPSANAAR